MPTIELWECQKCPREVPDFVHPHITREENEFLIEVYPAHLSLKKILTKGLNLKTVLRKLGFNKAKLIISLDESPNIDIEGNWVDCTCHKGAITMSIEEIYQKINNKGFGGIKT
jgi:hypothetical protein